MKNFHTLFEDGSAVEKAKKLGLEFQSHSVWKDPKTNKEWTWDGSNFVPYKGSSIGSEAGNNQTPVPDTLKKKDIPGQGMGMMMPGSMVSGAPKPGEEQPDDHSNWEPGPDGDNCVQDQPKPEDIPADSFVKKTNYWQWVSGPDGTNLKNGSFSNLLQKWKDTIARPTMNEDATGGNPTSASSPLTPKDKAKQMGLVSNGRGSWIDPQSGSVVARTVNGELVFFDEGPGGGVVSDGEGGQQMAQAQPSWVDPTTGMLMVPPSQPETPNEIATVPDPVPSKAPFGYHKFINQKIQQATANQAVNPDVEQTPYDDAEIGDVAGDARDIEENYQEGDLAKRVLARRGELPRTDAREYQRTFARRGTNPQIEGLPDLNDVLKSTQQSQNDETTETPRIFSKKGTNPQIVGQPSLNDILDKLRSRLNDIQDIGGNMAANGDELGDELVSSADSGNTGSLQKTISDIRDRDQGLVGKPEDLYQVTSSGGLGSDRGRYVEQGLTDQVLPELFKDQGLEFHNDGGPRVKTDVRSTRNGEDVDRYTVKSTVGTDGLEANNAGFRRFFDMWNLDPQSGPGRMFSHLMGIPLDWAQQNGFGDNLGLWDDKRDGLHRDGLSATRQMPLQLMYPGMNFSSEELNANSMLPETFQRLFPNESREGMEWLMDNRQEIVRRIMSQRDNDFGQDGSADPNARPNIDFDPNPVNRAAWYHLDKDSRGSANLRGRLDIHDVSPEQVQRVLRNSSWNLSPSISGGLSLDVPHEGRGGKRSLLTLTRKANKAGGGRYGNGFHSPRFGYKHNSFDPFPHVSSTPLEMSMGAKQTVPELKSDGSPRMSRDGKPKTKVVDGKIIPNSVKIGKTTWGEGYKPQS